MTNVLSSISEKFTNLNRNFNFQISHKFQLFLLSFKVVKVRVEIKVFNLTLAQMNVPEKSVPCFRPRPPEPLYNGFYHDSEKQELHIYWRPLDEVEFGSNHLWYTVYGSRG